MISSAALASSKRKRSSLGNNNNSESSPSKIPVKSPSGLGGMTVAYSPAPPSEIDTNQITTNPEDYSRKLQELRTAMELLKTPPKKNQVTPAATLTEQSSPLNRSWSLEHLAEKPADSSFLRMNSFVADSPTSSEAEAQERQEIETILSRLDQNSVESEPLTRIEHPISSLSSTPGSPMISAEELKRRLEATREAFQRSLAQVSSPRRDASDAEDSALDLLTQLERRGSQLRHVPVTFDDLEAEAQAKLEELENEDISAVEQKLSALEGSLSPVNLRRTSSQVDSIRAELEEMRASQQRDGSWLVAGASILMLVAVVALAFVLKMHFESGSLSVEKILMQAEQVLNYILQD